MAASGAYAMWLLESKEDITKSKEWNGYVHELHDVIQQQLMESHVQHFSDLSDAEKTLFVERASNAIREGDVHGNLFKKVSTLLDQHLNNEISRTLLEDSPTSTKTDLLLDHINEATVAILRKWPMMKSKLHMCLNQPLPKALRQLAWRLFLVENSEIRKKYVDVLSNNPKKAISGKDVDITSRCEQLIKSQPALQELKGSVGAFYAMKAVLSYHHAQKSPKSNLLDVDYMLIVPFVQVALPNIPRTEPASSRVIALLVEEFISFVNGRPGYMVDSGSQEHSNEVKGFVKKVIRHICDKKPEMFNSLSKLFSPSEDEIVTTMTAKQSLVADGLSPLIRPITRAMFVGFLNPSVTCFMWDQYIIGSDVPGYHSEWLSAAMATLLMLLQEPLKKCKLSGEMMNVVLQEAPKISIEQVQYMINRYFYRSLAEELNKDGRTTQPALDPTQVQYAPWDHWSADIVSDRTRPQDRQQARMERQMERQRMKDLEEEAEAKQKQLEDNERRKSEKRQAREFDERKQQIQEEKQTLEDLLERERERREESERAAAAEIQRLRAEIEQMKKIQQESPVPSRRSVLSYNLVPPPPSAASRVASSIAPSLPVPAPFIPIPESPTPTPASPAPQTPAMAAEEEDEKPTPADEAILDFLKKVAAGFNQIAHGNENEKEDLNRETQNNKGLRR